MSFVDRVDAGRRLAERLLHLRAEGVVVLGLPRVPVAFEVAPMLGAPLDVIVVGKLGVPFQPELAMGAIGEGDVLVMNERVVRTAHVSEAELAEVERQARGELERRARRFRGDRPRLALAGRTAVVVDDGIATGSTARAACQVARAQGAAHVVLAVPVCSPDSASRLRDEVDELVCLETPEWFFAVGQFYADFRHTSDEEVMDLLRRSEQAAPVAAGSVGADPPQRDEAVEVAAGPVLLAGHLTVPEQAGGVVVFAHGSGSSRHSPRNRYVAGVLQRSGLATLLFDLLTPQEELQPRQRVRHRAAGRPAGRGLHPGAPPAGVRAPPDRLLRGEHGCRGGAVGRRRTARGRVPRGTARPGRSEAARRRAPTLLIVGGHDTVVLELNRQAQARMRCESRLAVVPGATHLFEEPGTLERAAALAGDWFVGHLVAAPQPST